MASSPGCSSISSKCTLRASMRTGVPVFMRCTLMPCAAMEAVRNVAAGSEQRPPATIFRPMCMSPLRKVPAVTTAQRQRNSAPHTVRTPQTWPSATKISATSSCQMSRFSVFSSVFRHSAMKRMRSHWARGLHMAGPFERFSMRNCIVAASVTRPICPPSASISRTICPFAIPPTAGLHDICAILFISIVMMTVFAPMRAAAAAASQPAWPAPMTTTS